VQKGIVNLLVLDRNEMCLKKKESGVQHLHMRVSDDLVYELLNT